MRALLSAFSLGTLLLCACSGEVAPPMDTDTEPVSNAPGPRGQWVLINYWAEWCAPCIKEIPELNEVDRRYADITVLGVNFDGVADAELQQQTEKLGVEFPTLATDPAAAMGLSRPQVLPTTLVVSPEGQLHDTLVGPQTIASLAAAVGKPPPRE